MKKMLLIIIARAYYGMKWKQLNNFLIDIKYYIYSKFLTYIFLTIYCFYTFSKKHSVLE